MSYNIEAVSGSVLRNKALQLAAPAPGCSV